VAAALSGPANDAPMVTLSLCPLAALTLFLPDPPTFLEMSNALARLIAV
jgi:hypothetical protein